MPISKQRGENEGRKLLALTDRVNKLLDLAARRPLRDVGAHKDMARTALFLPGEERC
jgi:hypothetical protein